MTPPTVYSTIAEIRAANDAIDDALRAELAHVGADPGPPVRPVAAGGEEVWTATQVVAHLAEFPLFFAGELRRWRGDPGSAVGRDHTHAERLAAVERASVVPVGELVGEADAAMRELSLALEELGEVDIDAATQNRKYGQEPLRAFLDRYVLGHKSSHVEQLRTALRN